MIKIAYIAGCTHSGSTLMNRLLGAHPDVVTLGSVKKFNKIVQEKQQCCCGANSIYECEFWGGIESELKKVGNSFDSLSLQTRRNDNFEQDNLALFSAIQKYTGAKVLIDSSRRSSRYQRLRTIPELDVTPIHLYKTPLAQAGSWKKKGRGRAELVTGYWGRNIRLMNALRNDPKAMMLSYEYFCQNPEKELSRLFSAFGLDFDPALLQSWGEQPIHTLGGNRMKFKTSSEIYLDEGWRKVLTPVETKVVQAACGIVWRAMRKRQFS